MTVNLIEADVMKGLRQLPDESVHCVVTSPPYWKLRDYGVAGQLGLEPTLAEYMERMIRVFDDVRRVLRSDGTLWLNMGDLYAYAGIKEARLKEKDLVGLPWMLAIALRDRGWWLRADCIWNKSNAMPESVNDRPSRAHEYMFLLSKSDRYFYDREAVKQQASGTAHSRGSGVNPKSAKVPANWDTDAGAHARFRRVGKNSRWNIDRDPRHLRAKPARQNESFARAIRAVTTHRNLRTVWTIATEASKSDHFATFPKRLVTTCILAGTSEGGACADCGSPLKRSSIGFDFGCECSRTLFGTGGKIACTVLDPFMGTGTTGVVASSLGRSFTGIELKPEYAAIAASRMASAEGEPRKRSAA